MYHKSPVFLMFDFIMILNYFIDCVEMFVHFASLLFCPALLCLCVCLSVCLSVCVSVYLCFNVYVYVCLSVRVYVCLCVCVC